MVGFRKGAAAFITLTSSRANVDEKSPRIENYSVPFRKPRVKMHFSFIILAIIDGCSINLKRFFTTNIACNRIIENIPPLI